MNNLGHLDSSHCHSMQPITLRVLDGSDRGRVFDALAPPVTIGREEGNTIQLNDERVSRFHVKIQSDHERLVLTDLESTNGTKVNGEDIQLRILKYGDMITVGKSVLLFGSRDEIAGRLASIRSQTGHEGERTIKPSELVNEASSFDFELNWSEDAELQATLHALEPPSLPDRMTPAQAAQLGELLVYFHHRFRSLLASVESRPRDDRVTLDQHQWQYLLDLQARVAEYLRQIGEPHEGY